MVIIDKLIIYIACILLSLKECSEDVTIVLALIFLSLTSFYMAASQDKIKSVFMVIYLLMFMLYPSGIVFLPLFLYDWLEDKKAWQLVICLFTWIYHMEKVPISCAFLVLIFLVIYLFYKTKDLSLSRKQKIL